MVQKTCPHDQHLTSFVRCELSQEVAASVLDHLEQCPQCEEAVAKLEHSLQTLNSGAGATIVHLPFTEESGCQRAVDAVVSNFSDATRSSVPGEEPGTISVRGLPAEMETLRDFRIVEKIGQGGMGAVYKAVHQRMQRTVALKVLPASMMADPNTVARFNREMSVLGQLNHSNIVQAFDAGEHEGQHYLAMEFIEGQDLSVVLRQQGRLSIENACLITSQVASALQYAHEKGFVHRDIKPSNLMLAESVSADGHAQAIVKVLDLGLARVFDPSAVGTEKPSPELTSAGQIMGTLDYMAPEQGSDSHQVDIRTDIYSLGATLYKLLTGDVPFAEHATKAPVQRLMAMATQDIPRITTKRPDVPEKLANIVHRMLEKDPTRRFQAPVEVANALESFTTGANLASLLHPESPIETGASQAKASSRSIVPATRRSHSGGRTIRRKLVWFGGFAAMIALAAILVLNTRHGRIEVTSPDGKLPDDVRITVLNGGQDIAVLQAENKWSANVVNGEYQLQIQGGDDQFEIQDSKLTVRRLGKAVVVVELRATPTTPAPTDLAKVNDSTGKMPAATVPSTPATAIPANSDSVKPVAPSLPIAPEKPFALVRAGSTKLEFKTWAGAQAELQADDIVEISGPGPYRLPHTPFNNLSVTVRAIEGSRPELVFKGTVYHYASLQLHGLDLTILNAPEGGTGYLDSSTDDSNWIISKCRINAFGLNLSPRTNLKVSDSLLLVGSIGCSGDGSTVVLHNNVIVSNHYAGINLGESAEWTADAHFTLTDNTIVVVPTRPGGSNLFRFGHSNRLPGKKLHIHARNNLFALDGGPIHGFSYINTEVNAENPDAISWQGEGNLYCPFPLQGETTKDADGNDVTEHSLDAWARWAKRAGREPGSQIADWPHWQLATARWADDTKALEPLKEQVDSSIPQVLKGEIGPNWELLGVGDAYVRALAAAGREVAESDLRPEAISGGPCVILRDGKEFQGFPRLQDAIYHSLDKDIIEIRTDRNVGGISYADTDRQLTIRAGAGYTPEVGGIQGSRLNLEGLRFARGEMVHGIDSSPEVPADQIIRITNCVFPANEQNVGNGTGFASVYHESGTRGLPIIFQNCWIEGVVVLNRLPGMPIRFENCILPRIICGGMMTDLSPAETQLIQFDRCALWSPELRHGRGDLVSAGFNQFHFHVIEIVAERTLFETRGSIRDEAFLHLSGKKNLFRVGNQYWFATPGAGEKKLDVTCLEDAQQGPDSVTESFEAHPLAWAPLQWRLLPSSPGYKSGLNGKDVGVDVDQLLNSQ